MNKKQLRYSQVLQVNKVRFLYFEEIYLEGDDDALIQQGIFI